MLCNEENLNLVYSLNWPRPWFPAVQDHHPFTLWSTWWPSLHLSVRSSAPRPSPYPEGTPTAAGWPSPAGPAVPSGCTQGWCVRWRTPGRRAWCPQTSPLPGCCQPRPRSAGTAPPLPGACKGRYWNHIKCTIKSSIKHIGLVYFFPGPNKQSTGMLFSFYISMSIFCIFCGDCGNKITKVVIQCQILYVGGEN